MDRGIAAVPKARTELCTCPGSVGQEEAASRALGASSSRLSERIYRDGNIQAWSPPGPRLMGSPFSIRTPASFQTFLVNLWPRDGVTALRVPTFQGV